MNIEEHWGIIYAIMKSLNIKKIEIDKKYFSIDYSSFINMIYTNKKNGNITIRLEERDENKSN